MIRVSYKFGHSLEINTTMNEARGVVSQEIVMGGPDAVSTEIDGVRASSFRTAFSVHQCKPVIL